MECKNLEQDIKAEVQLELVVKEALSLLDPKGKNLQVSRAMAIVGLAASKLINEEAMDARNICEEACALYSDETS